MRTATEFITLVEQTNGATEETRLNPVGCKRFVIIVYLSAKTTW